VCITRGRSSAGVRPTRANMFGENKSCLRPVSQDACSNQTQNPNYKIQHRQCFNLDAAVRTRGP
jgi:hypothetical protein